MGPGLFTPSLSFLLPLGLILIYSFSFDEAVSTYVPEVLLVSGFLLCLDSCVGILVRTELGTVTLLTFWGVVLWMIVLTWETVVNI